MDACGRAPPKLGRVADRLIPYATGLGFTHVELLPIMEYPFGGSWGYQPLGLFAPTHAMATRGLRPLRGPLPRRRLGVILDWVPAHFPNVLTASPFRRLALYEHADPREGFHQGLETLIYNLGRTEVSAFLIASAWNGCGAIAWTGCGWMRWLHALSRLFAKSRASGCRTSMAGGKSGGRRLPAAPQRDRAAGGTGSDHHRGGSTAWPG